MTQPAEFRPRLNNLDLNLISRILDGLEDFMGKFLWDEKRGQHKVPQISYSLAVSNSEGIGMYKYALGAPLDEVGDYLAEAAHWMERVFELRGTSPLFPVTVVTLDPNSPPGKPRELSRKPLHSPGEKDYSLTNSASGLQGMYLALIVGDLARAWHLAEMVWDPPNADYIGPDSEVCTPDQQHLAYAVKQVILGDDQAALSEIGLISPKAQLEIKIQATMARAIVAGQDKVFLDNLDDLLAWHRKMALRKANLNDPDFFLSIAGLGLCALALQRGVVQREQLPQDNVYLPVELIPQN
jgi:hypothetical protein